MWVGARLVAKSLELRGAPDRKALLRGEPLVVDLLRADPAEEILGRLLVLRISHDEVRERHVIAELASLAFGQRGVERVVLERYPFLGEIAFGLTVGQKINRGAVFFRARTGRAGGGWRGRLGREARDGESGNGQLCRWRSRQGV